MKIIRLTTNNNQAIFDNEFNADITLNPMSQIALQNLVCESVNNTLIINSTNDSIEYELKTGDTKTINLEHNTYDKNNVDTLLSDIQKKLNANLESRLVELGIEWKVEVDSNQKVNIGYKRGQFSEFAADWVKNNTIRGSTKVWRSTSTADTSTNDNNAFLIKKICKGSGILRCRLDTLTNTGSPINSQGVIVALLKSNPNGKTTFLDTDISYGIYAQNQSTSYGYFVDGVLTTGLGLNPSIPSASDADYIEIAVEKGKIVGRIYNVANGFAYPGTELFNQPYDNVSHLYPCLIFRSNESAARVKTLRFIESPYNPTSVGEDVEYELSVPTPGNNNTNNYLLFPNPSLSTFLGFSNLRTPITGSILAREVDYTGDKSFEPTDVSDTFVIEMLNLKLDSYDGLTGERRNILSVIPSSDKDNRILYDSHYPIFINLNNANPISIRNLRCRLLKNDLSPITIRGLAIMTILINDK